MTVKPLGRVYLSSGSESKNTNSRKQRKIKKISFSQMTEEQKKERIKYLWGLARTSVKAQVFLSKLKREVSKFQIQVYHDTDEEAN